MARETATFASSRSVVWALLAVAACGGSEFQGSTSTGPGTGGAGGDGGSGNSGGTGGGSCEEEVCDGADNDCDGDVDEDLPPKTCGRGECTNTVPACEDGAEPRCDPKPAGTETCDGKDNDCDGETDESDPQIGDVCRTGVPGGCSDGTKQCRGGRLTCIANSAMPETCNLADDDCNGEIDDGINGGACDTSLLGVCEEGTLHCVGGNMVCQPDEQASPEVCDGLDNDCDGVEDDGNPGGGAGCMTGQPGVCAPGTTTCQAGAIECNPNVLPSNETCNAKDDDCDGTVDEGNPGGGGACNTGLDGECATGVLACMGGAVSCMQTKFPMNETCNNEDDDCNGKIDDIVTTYFTDSFAPNNPVSWTLGPEWSIGAAVGSVSAVMGWFGDPDVDHSPTADDHIAGQVIGGNVSTTVHAPYYLTSPIINIPAVSGPVTLTYWRWLNADWSTFAQATVEVYDGTSWVVLWTNPATGVADSAWVEHTLDLTPHKSNNLRIRFGYAVLAQGSYPLSGWNIDDVLVFGSSCP